MGRDMPVYTIGYGNRTVLEFISLLKKFGIRYLIDVRSKPYSRYKPDFSREQLKEALGTQAIRYVFMGENLGGLPKDKDCYTDGRVDYLKLEAHPLYQAGVSRLQTAWEKRIPIAVMCTELKPEECHRSKLIGQTLTKRNIPVAHIDPKGELLEQEEVIAQLTQGQLNLFEDVFTSRKRYLK